MKFNRPMSLKAIIGLQGFFPLKGTAAVGVGALEYPTAERKRLAALYVPPRRVSRCSVITSPVLLPGPVNGCALVARCPIWSTSRILLPPMRKSPLQTRIPPSTSPRPPLLMLPKAPLQICPQRLPLSLSLNLRRQSRCSHKLPHHKR